MRTVDMRSDTLTKPTEAMRQAMARAEVGDDVFGEDPTVKRFEEMAAEVTGKAAAMFVPSGTMGNLAGLITHCQRGEEVLLGDQSHTFIYEQGGSAALGGIHPRTLPNQPDGTLSLEDLEASIRPEDVHFCRTRLLALENTQNRCNGSPLKTEYMRDVGGLARRHGLKIHVDGARLFNAAVALGVKAADLVSDVDSVTFCISKGLGAPVGSVLCGTGEFISEARRARKALGGGMRQAGVLAAAGIVALREMIDRLAEDHARAKRLAEGLAQTSGFSLDPERIRTNIVYAQITRNDVSARDICDRLEREGVRVLPTGPRQIRAVVYHQIEQADVEWALTAFGKLWE